MPEENIGESLNPVTVQRMLLYMERELQEEGKPHLASMARMIAETFTPPLPSR